ncbi:MAG TPA: M13 family metallopeptidase [Kofleriaceae bacterium]|nr:M13 family metallopeptidase [Kofleriaceae bacterium]
MRLRLVVVSLSIAACSGSTKKPPPAPATPPDAAESPLAKPIDTPPAHAAPHEMTLAESGIVPEWIDTTADPCNDFFAYACGGFTKTAEIPADRSQWGALSIVDHEQEETLHALLEAAAKDAHGDALLTKIGDYYAACMDEGAVEQAGLAPVQPLLDSIDQIKDAKDVAHVIEHLHMLSIPSFFRIEATQDFADATQEIAGFDQGGLGMPDRDYYLKSEGNLEDVRKAYFDHVVRVLELGGASHKDAIAAANDVMQIETALATIAQDKVKRRDPHAVYHRVERAGLKKAAPGFPWDEYFEAMGIADVTAVTVNDPKYFTGVEKILRKQKIAGLQHYLRAHVLMQASPLLSRAFVDEDFAMKKVLTGQKELEPRWRRCVRRTDQDLGELLGQPYVAKKFGGPSKQMAIDLVESVRAAMRAELDTLPWMDDGTRTAAKAKLEKMAKLVGYPDKWRTYDFPVTRTSYATNVALAIAAETQREMKKIGKPVDKNEWEMTPPTVNAYYEPSLNEIALPAGQLQAPFFGATFHPAVNFGSTGGGTIGHEMTHGFDDEGSQFDGDGNLRDWWSKATSAKFKSATKCVQDQYSRYEAVPGVHLNGKLTSGENIADIGGVKLGFLAYQAWRGQQQTPPPAKVAGYSDDQLYFLAYAQSWCMKTAPEQLESRAHTDPHSPPMWRVNGVIVDQPGFGAAFTCKSGTPMNPGNACSVW